MSSAFGSLLHCDDASLIAADPLTNLMIDFGAAAVGVVLVVRVQAMVICQMLKMSRVRGNLAKVD